MRFRRPWEDLIAPYVLYVAIAFMIGSIAVALLRRAIDNSETPLHAELSSRVAVSPAPPIPRLERIFVPDTVDYQYLIGLYAAHTLTAKGKRSTVDYIGKWMRVSAQVRDIFSSGGGMAVHLGQSLNQPGVIMSFSPEWTKRVTALRLGSTIEANGRIRDIDQSGVLLFDCELLPER